MTINAGSESGERRRVLVVDDDRDFALSLIDILESRGYETRSAQDPEAAFEQLAEFAPGVALIDLRLRSESGVDLVARLREARPDLICLIVTAYADVQTAVMALQQGAYDYLRKPLEIEDLLASLDRCFEKRGLESLLAQAQKREAIATLAGGIAHDFRNLLQIVLGNVDLMKPGTAKDDPAYESLIEIEHAASRGAELTRQLLSVSREESFERSAVDLNREIRRLKTLLRSTFPKSIDIKLDLDEALPLITSNPTQVERILLNLAVNARDAMPRGGQLFIRTEFSESGAGASSAAEGSEGMVWLHVRDTGKGMSQDVVDRVFDPFFTTKNPGEGTGLGLTAVAGIVRAHGGAILCRSEPGAGTTFSMSFEVPRQPVQESASLQTDGPCPGAGRGETILVMDDEDAILSMLDRALSNVGYHVLTAANVDVALEIYAERREDIALIILDLDMPRGGGITFLERVDEGGLEAKVIIASGVAEGAASIEQFSTRIAAFMAKPFTLSELEENIRVALES